MQLTENIANSDIEQVKHSLVRYAEKFNLALILDSNSHIFPNGPHLNKKFDLIAGFANEVDNMHKITCFEELYKIDHELKQWYLGFITYDLKNKLETLHSNNPDQLKWPLLFFFKPTILIHLSGSKLEIHSEREDLQPHTLLKELTASQIDLRTSENFQLIPRFSKEEYLTRTNGIMSHIHRGDVYELNFCQEFYDHVEINPYNAFLSMNYQTPSPFAAFLKVNKRFLISASPERFLKKEKDWIISQPMKGTSPRSANTDKDQVFRQTLNKSQKERAENIMITDLVRNDLAKIAIKNSVRVDELCGIYGFPHVFQMISTIRARIKPVSFADILKATFPMGSMTGAPKIKAMELIEKFETVKRGLYSGAVGYIAPGMDFDFNVVIRSMQYNAQTNYLSYMTGSAITALSDTQKEYEECLLKSYAINPSQTVSFYA